MNVFFGIYFEVMEAALDTVGVGLAVVDDKPTSAATIRLAEGNGVDVCVLRKGDVLADVLPQNIDLGISAGFGRIFKSPLLERFRFLVNFHPGIVEQNRGRHGLLVAALKKFEMMGITCHLIDSEEIDAGPIISQVRMPIDYTRNFDANHEALRQAFAPMARRVFGEYADTGTLSARSWTPSEDSYHPPLSPEQMQRIFDAKTLGDIQE